MHYMNPVYELAIKLCGLDPYDDKVLEESEEKVDDMLYEKYGIEPDRFQELITDLMPYALKSKSALTDDVYIGFADHEKSMWLFKKKVENITK